MRKFSGSCTSPWIFWRMMWKRYGSHEEAMIDLRELSLHEGAAAGRDEL
jgi:hypothetical protein